MGCTVADAAVAHFTASQKAENKLWRVLGQNSLLTYSFNRFWAGFLSQRKELGITHFAMIHDDVGASPGWADVLIEEMEKYNCDLMSAVIPIKDHRGLTSTAYETENPFGPRRLTMKEVFDLPETFTDSKLLVNTGLWVCKANAPWIDRVVFRQQDQIVALEDGTFRARMIPEDWDFSRQVKGCGGSIYATRKVQLYHELPQYHNRAVWGEWETDKGDPTEIFDHKKIAPGVDEKSADSGKVDP